MSLQLLNLGLGPDQGDGTPGRSGGQIINDNFTELYTFAPSAALLVDGSVNGTDQLFTGHIGIGATASIKTNELLHLSETLTDDGTAKNAQLFEPKLTGSPVLGGTLTSFRVNSLYTATPTITTGVLNGAFITAKSSSTSNVLALTGLNVQTQSTGLGATVTNARGISVQATAASSVTTSTGVDINDIGNASNVTTAIGLDVKKQTANTSAYGIRLNGDDLGSDITFGAGQDVRQHFNGTNLEFEGVGIAHTGSTVTHDGYVTIAINGVAYNFMTGS